MQTLVVERVRDRLCGGAPFHMNVDEHLLLVPPLPVSGVVPLLQNELSKMGIEAMHTANKTPLANMCYISAESHAFLAALATASPELQTGGDLFGRCFTDADGRDVFIVQFVLGPGNMAQCAKDSFMQDRAFLEDAHVRAVGRGLEWIGVWLSHHHRGANEPDARDLCIMQSICNANPPQNSFLMLLMTIHATPYKWNTDCGVFIFNSRKAEPRIGVLFVVYDKETVDAMLPIAPRDMDIVPKGTAYLTAFALCTDVTFERAVWVDDMYWYKTMYTAIKDVFDEPVSHRMTMGNLGFNIRAMSKDVCVYIYKDMRPIVIGMSMNYILYCSCSTYTLRVPITTTPAAFCMEFRAWINTCLLCSVWADVRGAPFFWKRVNTQQTKIRAVHQPGTNRFGKLVDTMSGCECAIPMYFPGVLRGPTCVANYTVEDFTDASADKLCRHIEGNGMSFGVWG